MSNKIKTFLGSIYRAVNKSDAELDLEKSISYMTDIIEGYELANNITPDGKWQSPENVAIIKNFYGSLRNFNSKDVRLSNNNNILLDVINLLTNVQANGIEVQSRLRDFKSNVISTTAIGADAAAIVRSVPHYYFMSRYAVELLNFLLANEINKSNGIPTNIPKKQVENLKENIRIFGLLLCAYGCSKKEFKTKVDSIPDTVLTSEEDARLEDYQYDTRIDIVPGLPNGFIGSPIYTIRSGIAKWQADRYHEAEDTKRLLQLRLNYYESLRNNGQVNAEIEEEIAYLQGQVSKLAAKLEKMEESIK